MGARTTLVYKVLSGVFLFLGAITLLNVVAAWAMYHSVLWLALGYGVIDFLIAYGCFARERWVIAAFALNFAGLAALLGMEWYMNAFSFLAVVVAVAAGIIAVFAYQRRRFLRHSGQWWITGGPFFLIWAAAFIYTVINL